MAKLPAKSIGGYWPYWGAVKVSALPTQYNTLYLFSARPVGGTPGSTGAVFFDQSVQTDTSLLTDLAAFRAKGGCVIVSIGGAGEFISLGTRTRSQAFVDSIAKISTQLGGIDGIDWDIESDQLVTSEIVWISQQLKSQGYCITFAPAPWRTTDVTLAKALNAAGVLDLVSPQYYDLSGLNTETDKINHLVSNLTSVWIPAVGSASKVGAGYGISGTVSETMSIASFVTGMKSVLAKAPSFRGAFCWELKAESQQGWAFANAAGPLFPSTATVATPIPSPTPTPVPVPPTTTYTTYKVVTGDTLYRIARKVGVSWQRIATANNLKYPYTITVGQTLKIPS